MLKLSLWAKSVYFFLVMAFVYWVFQACMQAYFGPIHCVKIRGDFFYVKEKDLVSLLRPYLHHGFLTLNLPELKQHLSKEHWIKHVDLIKQWPDTLWVEVIEQKPLAYWGEHDVLNEEGQLFGRQGRILPDLTPYLTGPAHQSQYVFHECKRMQKILGIIGLQMKRCELSQRQAWTLELNHGMKIKLGRQAYLERLSQWVRAYPYIFRSDAMHAEWVDLSYPSGAAIRWHEEKA